MRRERDNDLIPLTHRYDKHRASLLSRSKDRKERRRKRERKREKDWSRELTMDAEAGFGMNVA